MNAEGVVKHPYFRLKVDLSRFFHDARQYCWIFVDGAKVQRIAHIEQHIAKLFGIQGLFHLLLNDIDYLPPTEDARILEKNETILVVPGSGIDVDSTTESLSDVNVHSGSAKAKVCNGSMRDRRDVQSTNVTKALDALDVSNNTSCEMPAISTNNTTTDMMFYSVIDDTEADTDSKATDLMEDCNNTKDSVASGTKRKRVRKRRQKNRSQEHSLFVLPAVTSKENKPKKPKVIETCIIPPAKHIRFDDVGNENSIAKKIVQEVSKNDSHVSRDSLPSDLSALLALGKSSTPMFAKKKIKKEINVDSVLSNKTRNNNTSKTEVDDASIEKNASDMKDEKKGYYKNIELEKLPKMARKPQIKDIIAFKTLKIAADYTPQLSDFIVSEVIDFCVESENYTLRVLEGKEEIQVPLGKFSLSEDESICPAETFLLNHVQMKELRLIL
ncbi:hypothetical protein DMN91_009731 [Ooceraea biroi]|uniref:Uncharacterized protein n=1 Tax=Ooceraea biroi TaxID=2015173 RepID=A0A026WMF9_OOCBI|nr:uncharacterized protein LOC105278252 [Ooceraea biroi]EZA56304.1 hypothetical protein X777_02923 [Ooceraea biroi]RLU17496.1 hypothetical protein DMN91_009731 [Ooceraea biroi]